MIRGSVYLAIIAVAASLLMVPADTAFGQTFTTEPPTRDEPRPGLDFFTVYPQDIPVAHPTYCVPQDESIILRHRDLNSFVVPDDGSRGIISLDSINGNTLPIPEHLERFLNNERPVEYRGVISSLDAHNAMSDLRYTPREGYLGEDIIPLLLREYVLESGETREVTILAFVEIIEGRCVHDGSKELRERPTFGVSWTTHEQLVMDGFSFNGHAIDIVDNWHTDFDLASAPIGERNTVSIKVHSPYILEVVSLSLGIPEIGLVDDAEVEILLELSRNYTGSVGYDIVRIIHEQDEMLVYGDSTEAMAYPVKCAPGDDEEGCFRFDIVFEMQAPLTGTAMAVSAIDSKRQMTVTYVNEGAEFVGKSLMAPATHELVIKKSNQDPAETIQLVQQDRRYATWNDQYGNMWERNSFGTWRQLTFSDLPEIHDAKTLVMTRLHSEFGSMISEHQSRMEMLRDAEFDGLYNG